jgi:hypothetical protein
MECKLMLQSAFDWAKKGALSGGGSEFPTFARVFATVTIHHSLDRADKHSDLVWYGNGILNVAKKDGQEVLTGNVQAWVNKVSQIFIPSAKDDGGINLPIDDLFPNSPALGLLLIVDHSGMITVGKLINGKLIGGMPPSKFQATCDKELLTGAVNVAGDAICTVSFSLGSSN